MHNLIEFTNEVYAGIAVETRVRLPDDDAASRVADATDNNDGLESLSGGGDTNTNRNVPPAPAFNARRASNTARIW